MITDTLLKNHPIISNQVDPRELRVVLHELEQLLQAGKAGAVVELGCYVGTTSLFLRRLLDAYNYTGELHVYDSFEGLPSKTSEDQSVAGDQFVTGELHATRKQLIQNFKKAGLTLPVIHKGWFSDLTTHDIPATVMFAFLDGDYYESIKDSFRVVTPRLATEATILVDDYASEALPGAAKATDEWSRAHGQSVRAQASLGIIHVAS